MNATDVEPQKIDAVRDLEAELSRLLHHVRKIVAVSAERVSPGMLPGTFRVFTTINNREGMTLSALADTLMADKGQMSRAVRELEGLGFIERTPDPNDGRSSIITATPEGKERLAAERAPRRHEFVDRLADWRLDDLHQLTRLLHRLTADTAP